MSVRELWAALEADARDAPPGFLVRRVAGKRDIHVGLDKPSNRRMLMFSLRTSDVPAGMTSLPVSAGFTVKLAPGAKPARTSIQLMLGQPVFADVFVVLVEDLVEHVMHASTDQHAARTLLERIQRWQDFIRSFGPDGLSGEAQRGLYGELWFLHKKLVPLIGVHPSVAAWAGPVGAPQDFQLRGCAIEVKVSTAKQLQRLEIASERQLDDMAGGQLVLLHLSLDVRETGENTLPQLVQATREQISAEPEAASVFEDRLVRAGYLDIHAERYARASYALRERHYFLVREGFPRITERMLIPGTGDVTYSIAVAACMPYALAESLATEIIATNHDF